MSSCCNVSPGHDHHAESRQETTQKTSENASLTVDVSMMTTIIMSMIFMCLALE